MARMSSLQFTTNFSLSAHSVTLEREKPNSVLCVHSYFYSVINVPLTYYYGFKGHSFKHLVAMFSEKKPTGLILPLLV